MPIFRATIVIEKETTVEVEASNSQNAQEAIFHNCCEQLGEPSYRNPRIEHLAELDD